MRGNIRRLRSRVQCTPLPVWRFRPPLDIRSTPCRRTGRGPAARSRCRGGHFARNESPDQFAVVSLIERSTPAPSDQRFESVDLPAPLRPSSAMISFLCKVKLTS